jgi:hypothetical protein
LFTFFSPFGHTKWPGIYRVACWAIDIHR